MARYTPNTDESKVWGEGDWRPLLSKGAKSNIESVEMIGANSIKERLSTVILPSHNYYDLDTEDAAFPNSVAPCWTSSPDENDRRHFLPTAWAVPMVIYPFHGEKKEHWVSPSNRLRMIGGEDLSEQDDVCADAFMDLRNWIWRNKSFTKDQKDYFLAKPDTKTDAKVPNRSSRFVSVGWGSNKDKQEKHMQLLLYTGSAHSYILEQLRWMHEGDAPPRDPDYPRYLLGDPTAPKRALPFHVDKFKIDPKDNTETNVLCLTQQRGFLDANMQEAQIPDEVLKKRIVLVDPDNWNIPSYEEQVEYMRQSYDESVTTEMLRNACGHRCDVAERKTGSVVSSPASTQQQQPKSSPASDPIAAATGGAVTTEGFAPTAPDPEPAAQETAPVSAPSTPPASASPEAEQEYWAGVQGESPTKKNPSELKALFEAGQTALKVLVGDDWKAIGDCGLFEVAPPVVEDAPPPAVPGDEAPPSVPAESAPAVPADTPPTVGGGDAVLGTEDFRRRLFDDAAYAGLDADKKAQVDSWVGKAISTTGGDPNADLPKELVDEMVDILG